jgi:hypothetical protein
MAEPDPAYQRGIDDTRHFVTDEGKQAPHACVKQQWFIIPDQKLIEL